MNKVVIALIILFGVGYGIVGAWYLQHYLSPEQIPFPPYQIHRGIEATQVVVVLAHWLAALMLIIGALKWRGLFAVILQVLSLIIISILTFLSSLHVSLYIPWMAVFILLVYQIISNMVYAFMHLPSD